MRSTRSVLGALVVGVGLLVPVSPAVAAVDCAVVTPPPVAGELPPPGQLACTDLRGLDLLQEQLPGADLHGSNLAGVSLRQADLTSADLRGADLTGALLGQADLAGANLQGANLTGAEVTQTDLTNADLRGAVLTEARGIQVFLAGADLRGADLRGMRLGQADLTGADLRGADVTGADLTQAQTDGALGLTDPADGGSAGLDVPGKVELNPGTEPDNETEPNIDTTAAPAQPSGTQIAHLLLWPAAAAALAWWRTRLRFQMRHRDTTPLRSAAVVGGIVGIGLVVTGLYLAAVGLVRGFTHLTGDVAWAADPGPLSVLATEPHFQLAFAGGAFVLGCLVMRSTRRRAPAGNPPRAGSQVAVGKPRPGPAEQELSGPARAVLKAVAFAGLADLVIVVALMVLDGLPATGPWRSGTAVGHLVFVAVTTLVLSGFAARARTGNDVATPSGVVFAAGGREPYLWLSGTSSDKHPVSQALPWDALEQVHFIRVLGTADPASVMITVRGPGTGKPTEYPEELRVTPAQVAALRELLPPGMCTDHTRAPASD
ncbi:pentapeptide repeat-containing protein [Actinophytocola glycyrrhizae]|uniref:Pentapeptide repeat-containing protein n=1 Tax=Actinophytocola glycyrrhizae TaxID=2044873 RepID=A0ABV9RZ42_9PSEU